MTPEEIEVRAYEAAAQAGINALDYIAQDARKLANAIECYINERAKQEANGIKHLISLNECLSDISEYRAKVMVNEGILHFLLGENSEQEDEEVQRLITAMGVKDDGEES